MSRDTKIMLKPVVTYSQGSLFNCVSFCSQLYMKKLIILVCIILYACGGGADFEHCTNYNGKTICCQTYCDDSKKNCNTYCN